AAGDPRRGPAPDRWRRRDGRRRGATHGWPPSRDANAARSSANPASNGDVPGATGSLGAGSLGPATTPAGPTGSGNAALLPAGGTRWIFCRPAPPVRITRSPSAWTLIA